MFGDALFYSLWNSVLSWYVCCVKRMGWVGFGNKNKRNQNKKKKKIAQKHLAPGLVSETDYFGSSRFYLLLIVSSPLQFVEFLKTVTEDDTEVISFVEKRYKSANPHFTHSPQFAELLSSVRKKIEDDAANKFDHLRELCDELKAYRSKNQQKHNTKQQIIESDFESPDNASTQGLNSCRKTAKLQITESDFESSDNASTQGLNSCRKTAEQVSKSPEENTDTDASGAKSTASGKMDNQDDVLFLDFGGGSSASDNRKEMEDNTIEINSASDIVNLASEFQNSKNTRENEFCAMSAFQLEKFSVKAVRTDL